MIKYVHTNIISRDWKALASFYINTFDCKVCPPQRKQSGEWLSAGTAVANAQLEGVHLLLPGYGEQGPTLEIYSYHEVLPVPNRHANTQGLGHLAFAVDDVSLILEKLITHGGSKMGEVVQKSIAGIGTLTFTYARDPDGNLIELQHWNYE